MDLLIATKNKGKIKELKKMFEPFKINIKTLDDFGIDDIEETGTTFYENALIKAKHGFEKTGLLTIADDSGLEVDYLNGEPGVYSARYAGYNKSDDERIDYLLNKLKDAKKTERTARFKCVICLYNNEKTKYFEGNWEGEILFEKQGINGFGYDPIFFDKNLGKTAAELPEEEKAIYSHRGKAFKQFIENFLSIEFSA